MKVRSFIDLIDNRYHAQVTVDSLTAAEETLINDFGCPIVEVGGTIAGAATRPGDLSTTNISIVLPTAQKRLPFDFPVKQVFDRDDDEYSDVIAKVYINEITNRISVAKAELVAKSANFIGETTITI